VTSPSPVRWYRDHHVELQSRHGGVRDRSARPHRLTPDGRRLGAMTSCCWPPVAAAPAADPRRRRRGRALPAHRRRQPDALNSALTEGSSLAVVGGGLDRPRGRSRRPRPRRQRHGRRNGGAAADGRARPRGRRGVRRATPPTGFRRNRNQARNGCDTGIFGSSLGQRSRPVRPAASFRTNRTPAFDSPAVSAYDIFQCRRRARGHARRPRRPLSPKRPDRPEKLERTAEPFGGDTIIGVRLLAASVMAGHRVRQTASPGVRDTTPRRPLVRGETRPPIVAGTGFVPGCHKARAVATIAW